MEPMEFVAINSSDTKIHFDIFKNRNLNGKGFVVYPQKFSSSVILKTLIFRTFAIVSSPDMIVFDYSLDDFQRFSYTSKMESLNEDDLYCYYVTRFAMDTIVENGKELFKIYKTINPILFKISPMLKMFFAKPPISQILKN